MFNFTSLKLVLMCSVFFITACASDQHTNSINNAKTISTIPSNTLDACTIVLASDTSNVSTVNISPLDRTIARHQLAVVENNKPIASLERLGWAFVKKARVQYDPGYYKLAEQSALCMETKDPGRAETLLLRGHVLHNLHKFKEAEVLAKQLVEMRGLWFDYGLLGDVSMEQGQLNQAVGAYQKMMALRPSPQAYSRAAHLRWLKGDIHGAIRLLQLAKSAISARDSESAAWTLTRLAQLLFQIGKYATAEEQLNYSLALLPNYVPSLYLKGRLLLATGKTSDAIKLLRQAVHVNPLPEYQWALVEALHISGQTKDANTVAQQLLRKGENEDRRTYALYLASTNNQVNKAVQLAKQELEVRQDVFTLDVMSWAFYKDGDINQAKIYSQRALAEQTQDARLFYHAGSISLAAGNLEKAHQWLTKALALQHMLLPSETSHLKTEFAKLRVAALTLSAVFESSLHFWLLLSIHGLAA